MGLTLLYGAVLIFHPTLIAPAINLDVPEGTPGIMPLLFVTIACGAISGFHGIVSSGTSSKQLDKETDARFVGYFGAVGEGLLALGAIIATTAGYRTLTEWESVYSAFNEGGVAAFVEGGGAILNAGLGIPTSLSATILATMAVLFAATTMDTGVRLQRFVVQEIGQIAGITLGTVVATVIVLGVCLGLAFGAGADGSGGTGRLDGLESDPDAATDAHLRDVAHSLRRLMPEHLAGEVDKHMDLSRRSPGTHEAAVLERMTELVERGLRDYDLVVFDTAPSGHTSRLMALPEIMTAWMDGLLRRRDRLAGLRETLTDAARTSFAIVLTAERLPVLETIELHAELDRTGIDVGALVVNRRSPTDRGDFLARRRQVEDEHLATLRRALPDVPRLEVPLGDQDVVGPEALRHLARHLA